MDKIITILVCFIMGLLGINRWQSSRIRNQKKEIKHTQAKVDKRESALKEIKDVQKEINEIKKEEPPMESTPIPSGDHDSRIDRLNKLHKH